MRIVRLLGFKVRISPNWRQREANSKLTVNGQDFASHVVALECSIYSFVECVEVDA